MGDWDSALADYSKAIALNPKDIAALMSRAGIYRKQREFTKALDDCEAADRIVPDPASANEIAAAAAASTCKIELQQIYFQPPPNSQQSSAEIFFKQAFDSNTNTNTNTNDFQPPPDNQQSPAEIFFKQTPYANTISDTQTVAEQTRVQIAGTRVTLIPAHGLKGPPGASMLAGRENGLYVLVLPAEAGKFDEIVKAFGSPQFQEFKKLSDVEISLRSERGLKRAFIKLVATEQAGITRRRLVLIDDGKSAASVVAIIPKGQFDAHPSVAAEMDQMLETVQFTQKALAIAYPFKMAPPPGYRPIGAEGGQVQMFGLGEREAIGAIRMERPISPAELTKASDFVMSKMMEEQLD